MQKRIYFLYHERWKNEHAEPILRYQKELNLECIPCPSNSGVPEMLWPVIDDKNRVEKINEIVNKIKNPKALIIHHRCITQEILRRNLPLIILEHTDGTALELSRYLIKLPNVLGVIKGTRFKNLKNYNAEYREGMFQGMFLTEPKILAKKPELNLSESDLSKVELGFSFGCFPSNKRFLNYEIDFSKNRNIEISFIGETNYPRSKLITKHRQNSVIAVKNVGGIYNNKLSKEEFDKILLNSKICLSPYGYGASYRSFESLYAGCLTIQPKSDWVESWPNVYIKNQTYFECESNFSNLKEVKDSLIDNYKNLKDLRLENRKMLIEHYFSEKLFHHMREIIERCIKRM